MPVKPGTGTEVEETEVEETEVDVTETKPGGKYTDDDLNRILAEDRKRTQRQASKSVQQLQTKIEELLQNNTLTAEQRDDLEATLVSTKTEKEQLEVKTKKQEKALTDAIARAESAEGRYKSSAISRALLDAALPKAVSPATANLLVKELRDRASVDDNGVVTLKFKVTEDGELVEKSITPDEAVEILESNVTEYGTLFKSSATGGAGLKGTDGMKRKDGTVDVSQLSMEQYARLRKENPSALGL